MDRGGGEEAGKCNELASAHTQTDRGVERDLGRGRRGGMKGKRAWLSPS